MIFFDVGQGDASLIITPGGKKILTDGGPDNTVVRKLGEHLPYYDKKIDYIILSHGHADHVTGLNEVLRRYQVGEVIMTGASHTASEYLEFLDLIKQEKIPVKIIDSRQAMDLDSSITINFLYPTSSEYGQKFEDLNQSSIVDKLVYASTSFLFTGDFDNEEGLASSVPEILKSDVLKDGHHGSVTANNKEFLADVDPKEAVISVGAGNSYGLPNFRTIYELQKLGSKIFRTDTDGDITCLSDGQKFECSKLAN